MGQVFQKELCNNSLKFEKELERLRDKYSKAQHYDGWKEVDINSIRPDTLERYVRLSRKQLEQIESELDFTSKEGGADGSSGPSSQFALEGKEMTKSDVTQLTESSLVQRGGGVSDRELQPEDQGEEEQMSLHIHDMVGQTERALHRRCVSSADSLVLREYRRGRRQSKRSNLNNTFDIRLRHTKSNPQEVTSKELLKTIFGNTIKRKLTRPKSSCGWAVQTGAGLHNGPARHSARTACCSTDPPKSPAVKKKPDIFVSPGKKTRVKARVTTSLRSPRGLSRSSKGHPVDSASREPVRPQSLPPALPPAPLRLAVRLRRLCPEDHQPSPPLRAADCHHKLITPEVGDERISSATSPQLFNMFQ